MKIEGLLRAASELQTVRVHDEHGLELIADLSSVVVVGSTCVGKSTLVDAVRSSDLVTAGLVDVPRRYITRPARLGDSTLENAHVSADEFENLASTGLIQMRWIRPMEGARSERYGFHRASEGGLPLYSGNNALFSNRESIRPRDILQNALWVGVFAPDDVRERRLRARSPDLLVHRTAEVQYRLTDRAAGIYDHVHVVVENHGEGESQAPSEFVQLMRHLCKAKRQATQ